MRILFVCLLGSVRSLPFWRSKHNIPLFLGEIFMETRCFPHTTRKFSKCFRILIIIFWHVQDYEEDAPLHYTMQVLLFNIMEHNQLFILVLLCYLNGDMLTIIISFKKLYVHYCFHNISWDFVQHITWTKFCGLLWSIINQSYVNNKVGLPLRSNEKGTYGYFKRWIKKFAA
jgi:hypothetical protein